MTALMGAFIPPERRGDDRWCLTAAKDHRVQFADGSWRLCATSGLWNVNIGYGNERIAAAIGGTLRDASYLSAFRYENRYARAAAARLCEAAGPDQFERVVFSTSGGAANDLAMKIARLRSHLIGEPRRMLVVGLRDSYHGLTYGSFALTGEELGQRAYAVDQRHVRHVTPNDVDELRTLIRSAGQHIAAIVLEPVLGTGTRALTDEFVAAVVDGRREAGYLVVADEVATGFGRTGPMFASSNWPEPPDLLVSSKGLTNGTLASAAVLLGSSIAADVSSSVIAHGETQAGTAVAASAICATLDEFGRLEPLRHGRRAAARLDAALRRWAANDDRVTELRGVGMFRSVALAPPRTPAGRVEHVGRHVHELVDAVRDRGAVVHPGPDGVQLVPAITYSDGDVDELVAAVIAGVDDWYEWHRRDRP